jgi:hypothetical protein
MIELDRQHMVREIAAHLTELSGTWTVDGEVVLGEGSTVIVVTDLHGDAQEPNHVDVGVALNPGMAAAPVIWDCAAGHGTTPREVAETAARMWVETTGSTVLELLVQDGRFASHIVADDPDGLPGFHVLHGPVLPFGADREPLLRWVLDHPLLPALSETLPPHLDSSVNGVKLLFGGTRDDETVEVRVNGALCDDATDALRALGWPRVERPTFVKTFLLAFAEEHANG